MLRVHQIFLYNFLLIFGVTFVVLGIISYFILRSIEVNQSTEQLKNSIALIQPQLSQQKNFAAIAKNVKTNTELRLTLIARTGLVLAESHKDADEMDNHARRAEIKQAQKSDYGVIIRHSNSFNSDFLYVAKAVELFNQTVYLRMSISLQRVLDDFYDIWIKITLIFSIMSTIGFLLALRMSRRIEEDVTNLTNYLEDVSNKTYNKPLKLYFSYEFINIAGTLKSVVAKLARRERQRRRSTAKFKLMYKQQNDLLSAISHEFKNPLAAISGYAQTLQAEELNAKNEKIFHKFLGKIQTNSEKISAMLDRLALSVKLENRDLIAQKEHFNLGDTVKDAIATIEKKHTGRSVHFKDKMHQVYMDKTMIEMVIVNLLDNAMKYSSEDVEVKLSKKGLFVIDKGIGISESELANIQTKFYRVDKNSWDNSMGLGLAIVNYILNLHDKTLEVSSEPNVGSRFGFSLLDDKE